MNTVRSSGQVIWHELITTDPVAAGAFYSKVVSRVTQVSGLGGYTFLMSEKSKCAGIKRLDADNPRWLPQWVPYISAADMDRSIRSAEQMGARVLISPTEISGVGRLAILSDPQSCTFGICTPDPDISKLNVGASAFSWHELATTDVEAATIFYSKLFGWSKSVAHDMGAMGSYQLISHDGLDIAGIYKLPDNSNPSHWLSYVQVPDAVEATQAARSHGGRVLNGPMEVPGGSWITMMLDPQGATFAVVQAAESSVRQPQDTLIEPKTGRLEINSEAPSSGAQSRAQSDESQYGGALRFTREAADDELCLNVEDYASAVAKLFASADEGEFCLAVFGPWGRGKTFLLRQVDRALQTMTRGYRTINFSAWKYPSAPEVWVHLYEEFAKVAFEGPWYRALPNIVRAGVAKHGSGPLLWSYALLAFGLFPLGTILGVADSVVEHLYPFIGVIGFVLLITLVTGIRRTKARLSHRFLTPNRHSEKLGLQATIGSDLRNLLTGWIPDNALRGAFTYLYALISAGLIVAIVVRFAQGAEFEYLARKYLGLSIVGGMLATIEIGLVIVVGALLMAVLYWLRHGGASPRKILLVVDDLDRCKPEHLLSVMESIKLLIEDPEISRRIQVAMLLEEDVLKHAIFEKYGHLTDEGRASLLRTQYRADLLIWENEEKIFTAHLRLPVLAKSELHDLIEAFSGRRREREGRGELSEASAGHVAINAGEVEIRTTSRSFPNGIRRLGEPISGDAPQSHGVASTRILEKNEIDAILAALDTSTGTRATLGPRAIRAFIFRYQLARLLLNTLAIRWEPIMLAKSLAERAFAAQPAAPAPISANLSDEQKMQRVVDQVC